MDLPREDILELYSSIQFTVIANSLLTSFNLVIFLAPSIESQMLITTKLQEDNPVLTTIQKEKKEKLDFCLIGHN